MKSKRLLRKQAGCAAALAALLSTPAAAQINPIKHLLNESNRSLEYVRPGNSYLLCNQITPATIGGMPASVTLSGPAGPRLHLQVYPDALTASTLSKTYCTAYEVGLFQTGQCSALSTSFMPSDARRTRDGGYIICGLAVRTFEYTTCNVGPSYVDGFLLRTDVNGNPVWYKRYETPNGTSHRFNTVIEDSLTGNIIVGGGDGFIMSTTSTGVPISQQQVTGNLQGGQYSGTAAQPGYSRICKYVDPTAPQQTRYVLTGSIAYTDYFPGGHASFGGGMLTMVDATGMVLNNVQLTQDNQEVPRFLQLSSVHDARDGNVIMTGSVGGAYCGQHDANNTVLLKINPQTAAVSFMKMYENSAGVCQAGGSCAVVGASAGRALVQKDSAGSNIYVTGSGDVNGGGQYTGAIYLETDRFGNVVRYLNHDSAASYLGNAIVYNAQSRYPVYSGLGTSNKSMVVRHRNAAANTDCSPDALLVVTDLLPDVVPNDVNPETLNPISETMMGYNVSDAIAHYCGAAKRDEQEMAAVPVLERPSDLTVVPNPATGYADVMLPRAVSQGTARICDLQGRVVKTQDFTAAQAAVHFNTADLAPGLYSVTIQDGGAVRHATFIKH